MSIQLLLLDDVDELGRSGDVVSVKPGYARNYLVPQKKALVADKHTLRMQAKLQEERAKRAEVDRKEAEEVAARLADTELTTIVKVDPEGHLYGSVSVLDIIKLFEEQGIKIGRKNVVLPHPIKELGSHRLNLKLNEGVMMTFVLHVESDIPLPVKVREKNVPPAEAEQATDVEA
ncbi:MAG: 50S ribosomal protein L9 [Simkania sp.]|nr:50S ribosomal protein L9 [Simkania sp.]